MDAKRINTSERKLFLYGARLEILLWAVEEMDRQFQVDKVPKPFGTGLEIIEECPCGCGLKNDVCEVRATEEKRLADEIPF